MVVNCYTRMDGRTVNEDFHQKILMTEEQDCAENQVINIYPECTFERFEGFGGAITEAAAYVYSLMNEAQKEEVIRTYFSEDEMNYHLVRIHMDSCDFCLDMYEAMSDPADVELNSFSFERTEKYILPMLQDAWKMRNGDLKLFLSPWSPPAFMKSNGNRKGGGTLLPQYRGLWAKYICRYIKEFQRRGFEVQRISIQNEPHAVQTWDSCIYSAQEEKEFLKDYLYPEMKRQQLETVEVFIWDHNKERLWERVRDTVDEQTKSMIAGAAFHWYSGDHFETMELVKQFYPDIKLVLSESCLEYRVFDEDSIQLAQMKLCHEIIGDLRHGMQAFYDWNLLLNEQGGPNHVGNFCNAPFLFDTPNGTLMKQKTQEYYYQLSHYIKPDSKRIASTVFTDQLDVVSYLTPDESVVVEIFSKSETFVPVVIRMNGKAGSILVPPQRMVTCVIE